MTFDWTTQEPPESFIWLGKNGPVSVRLAFGPLAVAPGLVMAMAAASAAMTVVGGIASANAQRQAGENAYQDALARNKQLQQVAEGREAAAKQAQAAKQREGIEARRKGDMLASRARAVMSAGGGGVDEKIISGLMAEGEYGKDVALFEGDETARKYNQQAEFDRYSGRAAMAAGQNARSDANRAADWTMIGSVGKAGMSLATAYAGGSFGGSKTGIDAEIGDWSKYGRRWQDIF